MDSSTRRVDSISYAEFLANISSADPQPLLLGPALTRSWAASSQWVRPDGTPHLEALRRYANHEVQVADCSTRSYNEFERTARSLGGVLDLWARGEGGSLYVKDWHCVFELEQGGGDMREVYELPDVFKDDWLTPFFLRDPPPGQPSSDYRFTYVGPAGTFTPFHRDVFGSYSWSANVLGRKRWWLVKPRDVHLFVDVEGGAEVFDLRELEKSGDPRWGKIEVVEQPEGQTIFVPSGWWHQVENLDFCISINQNFIASATLPAVWANLLRALERCEGSILDVRDMIRQRLGDSKRVLSASVAANAEDRIERREVLLWEDEWVAEVQTLLEMDFGINIAGFWRMVLWNLRNPPAPHLLSPDRAAVQRCILPIVAEYKQRREWVVLDTVHDSVFEVERIML